MLPNEYIKQLSSGSFKIPSIHSFDILFVLTDDNRIARTDVNTLHVVYISMFKSDLPNFYEFLSAALNQRIVIPERLLANQQAEFFVLDEAVSSDFENGSLSSFLNKYLSPRGVQGYSLKHNPLNSTAINTVLYYLFTSNFKVQPVDSEESFLFVQM
jgi:DNA mismatch repair ATPase MutS